VNENEKLKFDVKIILDVKLIKYGEALLQLPKGWGRSPWPCSLCSNGPG